MILSKNLLLHQPGAILSAVVDDLQIMKELVWST